MSEKTIDVTDIHKTIQRMVSYSDVYIPEFTWGDLRIDSISINLRKRWIRGFEIKIRRNDFLSDEKWTRYSRFCSSLSLVCPEGLINPEEIENPFGLLWIERNQFGGLHTTWKKRPKNFQKRASMAWFYTYVGVIEKEFPRLQFENTKLKNNF